MKKRVLGLVAAALAAVSLVSFAGCEVSFNPDKAITVIVREAGSGTRSAFDEAVTDGNKNFLVSKDANGNPVYHSVKTAEEASKTGIVLTKVQSDPQAIGYVSLGSVNESIKTIKVNGYEPTVQNVLDGNYILQRPFVIMTKKGQTMQPLTADFLAFLKSDKMKAICDEEGVIFLTDGQKRANEGETAIPVGTFTAQSALPTGDKIVISGSTSMEKLINAAIKEYSKLYGKAIADIFATIKLEGSSVGRKAAIADTNGNVIGLSSAKVVNEQIDSFNVCLDGVAVIVNKKNDIVTDLTLAQLYDIYTGKVTKFSQL